jgi:hypothetical protein
MRCVVAEDPSPNPVGWHERLPPFENRQSFTVAIPVLGRRERGHPPIGASRRR